nr:type IV pilin N-terminal domain-containing protein [uncultured Methanoregula sp.]
MSRGRNYTDAVSPVVGVMLMLAVTIMIAAIVSTYAGGFSGGTEKSPQSSIRVTADSAHHRIYFEHNGGDPFMLSSINVVLRSEDNKTSLSAVDAGGSKVRNFTEVGNNGGSTDTTIQAGDTFYIEGMDDGSQGMKFGSTILAKNSRITWLVVDKETGKTISMGSLYL